MALPSASGANPAAMRRIIQIVSNGYHPFQFMEAINAANGAIGNRAFLQFVGNLIRQRQHADNHRIAAKCLQGPGTPLTHLNLIQRAFGHHDITAMREHTGYEAKTALETLGARGFSSNGHMAIAGSPDIYTQAHEAAHGVQQAGLGDGLQLKGSISETEDQYEQHADAVAGKVMRGESAEALLDQVAGGPTKVSTTPVSDSAPVQMMLDKDKLEFLVNLILDKRELPGNWPMMARFIYGVELDEEDIAYITARVPFAQPTPGAPVPVEKEASLPAVKIQETVSGQQETATGEYPEQQLLSDDGYKLLAGWILENDIRALFFGDFHSVTGTMLPVEIVRMLADRGMLHGLMMEFAQNKDDSASAKMLEDFITKAGLREAATLHDIKMKQDPEDKSWHIAQIVYVLHKQGIPYHVFGSPSHQDTRETLKKCLGGVPPGKVTLIMIGPKHLYPPEIGRSKGAADDVPESAYGLLSRQARNEYGVNIAGFNGCWSSNVYKYGHGHMVDVIHMNQSRSQKVTRQDKFYEKVLFPNIRDMSDKGEPFEKTKRFRERLHC